MISDTASDRSSELYRHGVSNQSTKAIETDPFAGLDEFVRTGERLQECRLAERDRAVLFRMAKPAVPKSEALRRHRRCGSIPFHPAVYAGICLA